MIEEPACPGCGEEIDLVYPETQPAKMSRVLDEIIERRLRFAEERAEERLREEWGDEAFED